MPEINSLLPDSVAFSEALLYRYKQEGYTTDVEKNGDDIILHVASPELQAMGIDAVTHLWRVYINDKGLLVYNMDMCGISFRITVEQQLENEDFQKRLTEILKMAVNALKAM